MIIAHRGASGQAPENTLAAFELGLAQGCDGVELDIHLSLDGELMVCHDSTVNRTTNGQGEIRRLSAETIQALDAGSWFSLQYAGERIPKLQEVFELIPQHVLINIEIKDAYDGQIESPLLAFLREQKRLGMGNIVLSSFDHSCLQRMKQLEPEIRIGLLYKTEGIRHIAYSASLGIEIYSLHPAFGLLSESDIRAANRAGLRTYPFTVNDADEMMRLTRAGASGIITDYPGRMKALQEGCT